MEILLVRHGRPDFAFDRVRCDRVALEFRRYEDAGIRADHPAPEELRSTVSRADVVLASDRRRAVESARGLGVVADLSSDSLFREVPLPHRLPLPASLRLNYGTWVVTARILWMAGMARGVESRREARRRAERACDALIESGTSARRVVLVAHGFINLLIGRELRRRGWAGPMIPAGRYWANQTYRSSAVRIEG